MGLFRRRNRETPRGAAAAEAADLGGAVDPRTPWPEQAVPDDPEVAASEFWRRWHDLLPEVSAALGDGEPQRAEAELCGPIAAIHPELQFSLDRGHRSIYALVITSQEDPALRPYTDAWKAAAPPDDAIWEFHDSVPPVPDPRGVAVNIEGQRVDLAEVRVHAQVDHAEQVLDLAVHHPALESLSDEARLALTFLPVDATLGERLAAERIRRVETALAEPEVTISLVELRDLVDELSGSAGPDANETGANETDGDETGGDDPPNVGHPD